MIQSLYRIRTEESGDYYVIAEDKDAAEEIFAKEMDEFPEQTTYAGQCITEDAQAKSEDAQAKSVLEGIVKNILTQPAVLEEFSRRLRAFEEKQLTDG